MTDEEIIAAVNAALDADDASAAYEILKPLNKADLFRIGYRVIGHTGYSTTKRDYLSMLGYALRQRTDSASRAHRNALDLARIGLDYMRSREHLARAEKLLANSRIDADSTAFTTPEGRAIQDWLRELERRFADRVREDGLPIPEAIIRRYRRLVEAALGQKYIAAEPEITSIPDGKTAVF